MPQRLPDDVAALAISKVRHRAGVDDIHIGALLETDLGKACALKLPPDGGGLRVVELAAQGIK